MTTTTITIYDSTFNKVKERVAHLDLSRVLGISRSRFLVDKKRQCLQGVEEAIAIVPTNR